MPLPSPPPTASWITPRCSWLPCVPASPSARSRIAPGLLISPSCKPCSPPQASSIPNASPRPEKTRAFLAAPRAEALSLLIKTWLESPTIAEWKFLPGITLSGTWGADPLHARRRILDLFAALPRNTWWDLESFLAAVRSRQPDILREGGDYDRWFIRDESGTEFQGFDSWMQVEGSLLRFFATILNAFGMVDLGSPSPGESFGAFRLCADLE